MGSRFTFSKIRNIVIITWLASLVYFVYVVKDYEGRFLSELPIADKVFCWIFVIQTFTLAEVMILNIKGIERTPRTIFFTIFVLIAYSVFRITR